MSRSLPTIAVIGGTGAEGFGLATRWAQAGYRILIGSRSAERANAVAQKIGAEGLDHLTAASECNVAVLTVPFAAQSDTLLPLKDALRGKILVDVTVPLRPPKIMRVRLPTEGSAAQIAQTILGDDVRVVSAFQNVSAHHLTVPDCDVDSDVLVTRNDPEARGVVVRISEAAGLRAFEAGPLDNAAAAEAMTSLLLWINRKYKSPGAGIRITAIPDNN